MIQAATLDALHAALRRFPNVTFADRTPGAGLVSDDSGAVVGVLAGADGSERIGAKKVILACDGYGANREMLRQYNPHMAEVECIGAQGNTGDGIRWGAELGAALAHMSGHQGHGFVCRSYGTRLLPEMPMLGAIIVNQQSERFTREDQGYSELASVVLAQPGGTVWGELWYTDDQTVEQMDLYEEEGSLYRRSPVRVLCGGTLREAEAYVYLHEVQGEPWTERWHAR